MSQSSKYSSADTIVYLKPVLKEIYEPSISTSSLEFIREDEDEVEDEAAHRGKHKHEADSMDAVSLRMYSYKITRGIQVLKSGSPTSTLAQLLRFYDMQLDDRMFQEFLMKTDGIEVVVNILEVNHDLCNTAALQVIGKLANTNKMRLYLTNLGIIPNLIGLLERQSMDLKGNVARVLSKLCIIQKPARYFRKFGGIPLLVDLVDIDECILYTPLESLDEKRKNKVEIVTAAVEAVKVISKHPKNMEIFLKAGILGTIKKITDSCHKTLLTEMIQIVMQGTHMSQIRSLVENEGILLTLIDCLSDGSEQLRSACASTIAHCANESQLTRFAFRFLGGIPVLAVLTKDARQEKTTLKAIINAVSALGQDIENLQAMTEHGVVTNFIKFIKGGVAGSTLAADILEALAELARIEKNRNEIAQAGILPYICHKLVMRNPQVVCAAAKCLGTMSKTAELMPAIMEADGMRLLFSSLRSQNPKVQATALWALRGLMKNTHDSAEEVRNLTGALNILIELLFSDDLEVVAQTCWLIAQVARDSENLQVLSDCGLVKAVLKVTQRSTSMEKELAELIAFTSANRQNARDYGELGVVKLVRDYLDYKDNRIHTFALQALAHLTEVPFNCVALQECGGVEPVLRATCSPYIKQQEAAAVVLRNMRKALLEVEHRAQRADYESVLQPLGRYKEHRHERIKIMNEHLRRSKLRRL